MIRFCALTGPVGIVGFLFGFAILAGFVPPTDPTDSAEQIAAFYGEHLELIRFGLVLTLPSALLFLFFFVAVSHELWRLERPGFPVLAILNLSGALILLVFFVVCSMVWITASFRQSTDAEGIRQLHDLGWLIFVMVWPEYTIQMCAIGYATLKDTAGAGPFPRWFGWFCFWVALSGAGGTLAVFFKDGPFAWNGLVGFYIPFAVFVIWLGMMTTFLLRAAPRSEPELDPIAAP